MIHTDIEDHSDFAHQLELENREELEMDINDNMRKGSSDVLCVVYAKIAVAWQIMILNAIKDRRKSPHFEAGSKNFTLF